ncbi:MAG TPA: hypothetical protein VFM45_07785 [Anaeromyxobacteraceae bacterium]|nr:hypothetical protein [Anaeromyxobacteraceae bacterium]
MANAWKVVALMVPVALVAACTDGAKAPAEAAMAAASTAMESLKGDAARYAPEEVKKLESTYGVARDSLANKDYQGALTFTKDIPARAKEVLAKADAAKADLAKAWKEAGDGIASTLEAAKHHLSGHGKPPAGLDKAGLARVHADLQSIEDGWATAKAQYGSGDLSGAVAKAKELNAQGQEVLKALGAR